MIETRPLVQQNDPLAAKVTRVNTKYRRSKVKAHEEWLNDAPSMIERRLFATLDMLPYTF